MGGFSDWRSGLLTTLPLCLVTYARHKEYERARVIYKYALDNMSRESVPELYREFVTFEKKHGNREAIEDVIVGKRRTQYEEALSKDPLDFDTWFDYIRLEESQGDLARIREVYERAIAQQPPVQEKRFWRRYIYLWINYALFEELQAADVERTREVYKACLKIIPHEVSRGRKKRSRRTRWWWWWRSRRKRSRNWS